MHVKGEIVRDFDGLYYANLWLNGVFQSGIKEYVTYRELRESIRDAVHVDIGRASDLRFVSFGGRKSYAEIDMQM